MNQELGTNPWLSIWTKPRQTIRSLIQYNVNYRFVILCAIYGFQYMLQTAQFLSLGRDYSLVVTLIASVVLAIPIGYIIFNITSFFLLWVGKMIKGKGNFKEIRAAAYWTSVPNIVTILIWIVLMCAHGNSLFVAGYERGLTDTGVMINVVAAVVQIVVGIWALVIFLQALGEVQGFSAWMALLNSFLAGLAMFILLFLVVWGVSSIVHA